MSKPVRRHNRSYSGGFPSAVGDRFYAQDIFRDQAYLEGAIGGVYNDLTQLVAPYVLSGLVCAQGAGHTMDVSAGKAVVPYQVTVPDTVAAWTVPPSTANVNIDMVLDYAGVTGVSLAGATADGVTPNYVKLAYTEINGNTRNRAKKAGSYAYEVYDSVIVTIDAVAPTATEINILTFTTDGATVTITDNGGTRIGSPFHIQDAVIHDQTSFNNAIVRVAANQYKIRDDIKSMYCANLSGGYDMYSASSPLSGGDTWGYIETNNCKQIIFEQGAYIYFENVPGYVRVNTDDCYLKNVYLKGLGTVTSAISYSFVLAAYRVQYIGCKVSDRLSNVNHFVFQGSGTTSHNTTSSYINCITYNIENSANDAQGFNDCMNMESCIAYDITTTSLARGFDTCERIANCYAENITSGSGAAYGFNQCYHTNTCKAYDIDSTGSNSYGFYGCLFTTNCKAEKVDHSGAVAGASAYGFNGCNYLTNCWVTDIETNGTGASVSAGYDNCDNIDVCFVTSIANSVANAYGFFNCNRLSTCTVNSISHNGAVAGASAYGFNGCNNISSCVALNVSSNGAGGSLDGFNTCKLISDSSATSCGSGFVACDNLAENESYSNSVRGFSSCSYGNGNYAHDNGEDGFRNCDNMTNCFSDNNTSQGFNSCDRIGYSLSTNNGAWGFINCNQIGNNRSTGNASGQYSNCFSNFGASLAVADTANGGFNG